MLNEQDATAEMRGQAGNETFHLIGLDIVKTSGGFVQQEMRRSQRQTPHQGDAAFEPLRQVACACVGDGFEIAGLQKLRDKLARLRPALVDR